LDFNDYRRNHHPIRHQGYVAGATSSDALREFKACCQYLNAGTSARTDEAEWFNLQSKSLVSWARKTGWLLDTSEFANLTAHLERYEGGSEHIVMFLREQGRVIKVTKNAPCFGLRGDLLDYLLNIEWSNQLFGDDIQIAGVLETSGLASVVTTQPFIVGTQPTVIQVDEWFQAQGFVKNGHNKWKHPTTNCEIADAHTGTLLSTLTTR
jgi:hypothetical protein